MIVILEKSDSLFKNEYTKVNCNPLFLLGTNFETENCERNKLEIKRLNKKFIALIISQNIFFSIKDDIPLKPTTRML